MSGIRYIGSKERLASAILERVGSPSSSSAFFVDLFSGTGAVSREAAKNGWKVKANDHLKSSAAITTSQLVSPASVRFERVGGYLAAIRKMNQAKSISGFIHREYTPSGLSRSGHSRRYFSEANGRRIDGIRAQIDEWWRQGLISGREQALLIGDLLAGVSRVANIAGTYGCFLAGWAPNALRSLELTPRLLLANPIEFEVLNRDAYQISTKPDDVVYLDPPYTKRQYAAYYHLLETIAEGDEPEVSGITGLRPWRDRASPFCYKRQALPALLRLIEKGNARRTLISYSSRGHVALRDLHASLKDRGVVRLHRLGAIGRYRPNKVAGASGATVTEYLLDFDRPFPDGVS